jgi:hypothetical protein
MDSVRKLLGCQVTTDKAPEACGSVVELDTWAPQLFVYSWRTWKKRKHRKCSGAGMAKVPGREASANRMRDAGTVWSLSSLRRPGRRCLS